ncbi:MAG TPA: HPF/RaiA family ribosome-associated protein [Rhizomicrobium sp.]|jgi:cold shock CspA family protein/ribosome-associated translation inhibitor RaiA|nr:HPF/RaiA family ribosome-associated protein [Rhizomicrobium sp.]
MDIPLEIAFHGMNPSDEVESLIAEHVNRLERFYPHLVGCRVSVEIPHKQHRHGNLPGVHIIIRVPGHEIAISREPHKAKLRRIAPNVHTAITDAFRAAEKRLMDFKQQQYGEVKAKEMPVHGTIAQLIAEKNYGFIATGNGEELYFHRNAVADGGFDDLRQGDAVQYCVVVGDKGPSAGRVWRTTEASTSARVRNGDEVQQAPG